MKDKFNSLSSLSKTFVVVSILLVLLPVFSYLFTLTDALAMDKASYNCTSDSMMMQLCHDPFTTSIGWAILYTVIFGLPILLVWLVLGVVLLIKRRIKTRNVSELIH